MVLADTIKKLLLEGISDELYVVLLINIVEANDGMLFEFSDK